MIAVTVIVLWSVVIYKCHTVSDGKHTFESGLLSAIQFQTDWFTSSALSTCNADAHRPVWMIFFKCHVFENIIQWQSIDMSWLRWPENNLKKRNVFFYVLCFKTKLDSVMLHIICYCCALFLDNPFSIVTLSTQGFFFSPHCYTKIHWHDCISD